MAIQIRTAPDRVSWKSLKTFLRIPGVSTLPEHKPEIRRAAEFCVSELKHAGRVHATALVDPSASIAATAEIGPYCIVTARVEIGAGTRLVAHVYVEGPTSIGEDNRLRWPSMPVARYSSIVPK